MPRCIESLTNAHNIQYLSAALKNNRDYHFIMEIVKTGKKCKLLKNNYVLINR